jgi:hypothetical protein
VLEAAASPFRVTLTWEASPDPDVEGYRVFRDDEILATVSSRTRFVDGQTLPGQRYTYGVEAVSAEGITSERTTREVTTPAAPAELARVEGLYGVSLKEESHHGYAAFRPDLGAEWEFSPACDSGPCDVTWAYLDFPEFEAELRRNGRSYSGSDDGRLDVPCDGSIPVTTSTIRFRVAEGGAVDGQWRATELRGTLVERTPSQFGCVSAGVTYSFTASALPAAAAGVVEVYNTACRTAGSGFIAEPGYVVTNAHVVAGASRPFVVERGRELRARVVVFAPKADIAVLRVGGLAGAGLPFSSATIEPGTPAFVLGFPEGASLTATDAAVTRALSVGRNLAGEVVPLEGYRLRAQVRHGNSGGPVVLEGGQVVGVIASGNGRNVGYAVAASEVLPLLERASAAGRAVDTGTC